MQAAFSTSETAPAGRRAYWQDIVSEAYFPLELRFAGGADFAGRLAGFSLGPVSVSRQMSDGVLYRRHERHLRGEREECYLVTVPELAEIRFEQDGRDVCCRPGSFLIERSHLPYEFSHREPVALWVLKLPSAVLRTRIARPERLATLQFDATRGVGAMFVDMVRLIGARIDEMDAATRVLMGKHVVDLLAMAIEADERVLVGQSSSVRSAHLLRCEQFIRRHLGDGALTPQQVADGCGISLRYLHKLFEAEGMTVSTYIRTQRLLMGDALLRDPRCGKSISEIAYLAGFCDQAQFSRGYRARFGCTPSEARAAARASRG